MSQKIYLIEYNGKIIGSYLKYNLAKTFILSCFQNNLIHNSIKILTYKADSCYCIQQKIIHDEKNKSEILVNNIQPIPESILNDQPILNDQSILDDQPILDDQLILDDQPEDDDKKLEIQKKILEINNKKIELNQQLNIIKYNKEKLKESKTIYEADLKLFEKFNTILEDDHEFKIPELFKDKFLIFKELYTNNNLSYDNFSNNYYKINNYDDFPLNNYETSLLNTNDFIEEFNLDSDNSNNII
jgi:hypothetical protein